MTSKMTCEFSAVLVGRYAVGKTTLFKTLKAGKPPDVSGRLSDETGVDSLFYCKSINGRNVRVTLWDTGGQERHDSLTSNYYRSAHAVVLVYSLEEESSLYALSEWVAEALEMSRHADRLVLALWGTKADLPPTQRTVKPEAVEALSKSYDIPSQLNRQVSIYEDSLEQAMTALMEHLYTTLGPDSVAEADSQDTPRKNITLEKSNTTSSDRKRVCCSSTPQ